jgi:hypothetical protein
MQSNSKRFTLDGGALTYLGTGILILVLVMELGEICTFKCNVNQID